MFEKRYKIYRMTSNENAVMCGFFNKIFIVLPSAISLSLAVFCSMHGRQTSVLETPLISTETDAADTAKNFSAPADSSKEKNINIREMIIEAREYCIRGKFANADSLAREILPFLVSSNEMPFRNDTLFLPDKYIDDIVSLYIEIMPETIPIPEEIAPEVIRRKFFASIDSSALSPDDSIFISGFLKQTTLSSEMPLAWNNRVFRALLYYLTINRGIIDGWKKRAPAYLPFIKRMFVDSGLPQDLAYLPLIESGFNPKAYSKAHASGIWQFVGSTAKTYGLRINYWIDERRDPIRSTQAAIRYLKKLYRDFGDWHLVLAAYNYGENGLSRTIKKKGHNNYWELDLPAETMNYVPLYLASLTIAKSKDFTSAIESAAESTTFDTVYVSECIDLMEIAKGTGIDYEILKNLNPHILRWCTPPYMSDVCLYLPSGSLQTYRVFYSKLTDEKKVKWYRYKIQPGDNLIIIARRFRLSVEAIKSVNRLKGSRIVAGEHLFLPIPAELSERHFLQKETETILNEPHQTDVPGGAALTVYEVKPGETVWRLAELFGVSADSICLWNNLDDYRLRAGQIISIYTTNTKQIARTCGSRASIMKPPSGTLCYIVGPDDNLGSIAQIFSTTVERIRKLNGLSATSKISSGDTLFVPKPF